MSALEKLARDLIALTDRAMDETLPKTTRLAARESARRVANDFAVERGAQPGDRVRIMAPGFGDVVLRRGGDILVKIPASAVTLALTELVVAAGELLDAKDRDDPIVDAEARLHKALTSRGHFRGGGFHLDVMVDDLVEDVLDALGLGDA